MGRKRGREVKGNMPGMENPLIMESCEHCVFHPPPWSSAIPPNKQCHFLIYLCQVSTLFLNQPLPISTHDVSVQIIIIMGGENPTLRGTGLALAWVAEAHAC